MPSLKDITKLIGEAILETVEEGIPTNSKNTDESDCNFSNSYRLNSDNDIVTDFEGRNAPENGGVWLEKGA
ncbi:hypothetical protein [Pseudoalteromonas sp. A757]|uniref:hypothetical protein n=1 Tax=Pseudoalteromonas sp. A757 TaxID=2250709 RepID=UPI000FFF3268|nr:hypothetical protein [Pseudoalteromonas sp. A757]RXE84295.1 hypothetical protein DRB05_20430 [Pseudoalteromonas sp. A757]